jgi:hypothetical protein
VLIAVATPVNARLERVVRIQYSNAQCEYTTRMHTQVLNTQSILWKHTRNTFSPM